MPVLGITGTGGAGKSSLTDELIRRLRLDQGDALRIAVISIDPQPAQERRRAAGRPHPHERDRRRGSAGPRVFMRSLATRDFGSEISQALPDVLAACKAAGFDLIVVETSGIGQGDAAIVPLVDVPMYVMTPEFGAASQLEKIDMLDFAEFVAINKFDRKGAADALRDVAKQVQRNREAFKQPPEQMPVFGTMASRFNDDGVTALYQALLPRLAALGLTLATAGCRRWPRATARTRCPSCPARACATWPTSPTPCAATSSARCAQARAGARDPAAARRRARMLHDGQARASHRAAEAVHRPGRAARGAARPAGARSCWRCGPTCSRPTPATSTW